MLRQIDANVSDPSAAAIAGGHELWSVHCLVKLELLLFVAVRFHATKPVVLVAGQDKLMRFFSVDGDKNDKLAGCT
jgi:hypothetical protein